MHSSRHKYFTNARPAAPIIFRGIGVVVFVLCLFSCSSMPPVHREMTLKMESTRPIRYSIVFIIHGNGDYLYHDTHGREHRADEEVLVGATRVAMQNPQAEVFIFHERPRRRFLLLFTHQDSKFYYYRNGKLLAKESYQRDQRQSRFDHEVNLYYKYRKKFGQPLRTEEQPELARFFLYFGHEIPEVESSGYDASNKRLVFTVNDLAVGLKDITTDFTKFDLIVLSTCYGGTPHTISALAPYARTIVASPGNLHLSYFDLHPFERLDDAIRDSDVHMFAKKFAQQAFDRLTKDVQTAVTVAVYDVDIVREYLSLVDSIYDRTLRILNGKSPVPLEHCDCAKEPAYNLPGMSNGVDILYRPAQFGQSRQKQTHSGWECLKKGEPLDAVSNSSNEVQ